MANVFQRTPLGQGRPTANPFAGTGNTPIPQLNVAGPPRSNIFDTINTALQLRRKNEKEAREDQLETDKFELETLNTRSEIAKRQRETELLGQSPFANLGGVFANGVPPGTKQTVNSKGETTLTFPLNREFTAEEAKIVTGGEFFSENVEELIGLVESGGKSGKGVFGEGFGRFGKQLLGQSGSSSIGRLLTPDDSDLEKVSSLHAFLKQSSFAIGGKQLTPLEEKIVSTGLNFTGKGNKQIAVDLRKAISVLVRAGKLIREGSGFRINDQPNEEAVAPTLTPEQQASRDRIREKFGV